MFGIQSTLWRFTDGPYRDASASLLGGLVLTNNKEFKILKAPKNSLRTGLNSAGSGLQKPAKDSLAA